MPTPRLRALEGKSSSEGRELQRLLRDDGLVEFRLAHKMETNMPGSPDGSRIYVGWLVALLVGALAQIEHLRRRQAWEAVAFGLEFEVWSSGPLALKLNDRGLGTAETISGADPLILPLYEVPPASHFNVLTTLFVSDLLNAWGRPGVRDVVVPWGRLLQIS